MKSENRTKKTISLFSEPSFNLSVYFSKDNLPRFSLPESIIKNYNFKKRIVNFEKYTMKLIP